MYPVHKILFRDYFLDIRIGLLITCEKQVLYAILSKIKTIIGSVSISIFIEKDCDKYEKINVYNIRHISEKLEENNIIVDKIVKILNDHNIELDDKLYDSKYKNKIAFIISKDNKDFEFKFLELYANVMLTLQKKYSGIEIILHEKCNDFDSYLIYILYANVDIDFEQRRELYFNFFRNVPWMNSIFLRDKSIIDDIDLSFYDIAFDETL